VGLINGSASYRKYLIEAELPGNLKERMARELPRHAFREINPATNPEVSVGWVNAFNPLDTQLTLEKVLLGKYLILAMRKDRKSVPPMLFKARLAEAMRAQNRKRHGRKLSPEEIVELRDTVKQQMLANVSPATTLHEMAWDYESQEVYFSSLAAKANTEFQELFEETFGLPLTEITILSRAEAEIESRGLDLDISTMTPAHFGR
jgi:hypothetical protein